MGAIFHTSIDSEVIAYLIARERLNVGTVEDAVKCSNAEDPGCVLAGGHASPSKIDRCKRSVWIQPTLHR